MQCLSQSVLAEKRLKLLSQLWPAGQAEINPVMAQLSLAGIKYPGHYSAKLAYSLKPCAAVTYVMATGENTS